MNLLLEMTPSIDFVSCFSFASVWALTCEISVERVHSYGSMTLKTQLCAWFCICALTLWKCLQAISDRGLNLLSATFLFSFLVFHEQRYHLESVWTIINLFPLLIELQLHCSVYICVGWCRKLKRVFISVVFVSRRQVTLALYAAGCNSRHQGSSLKPHITGNLIHDWYLRKLCCNLFWLKHSSSWKSTST